MANSTYEYFESVVNAMVLPATVFCVKKDENGHFKEARFFVSNKVFRKSFLTTFRNIKDPTDTEIEDARALLEGTTYDSHLPKDGKFENILMESSFEKKHVHTYVDTTNLYSFWTEDMLLPIICPENFGDKDPDTAYCIFMYTLNKEMDSGKFSSVSPDISSFVIKACLDLRNENSFESSMEKVVTDIREYTDAFSAVAMTFDSDNKNFKIIAESSLESSYRARTIFSNIPYEIVESWQYLLHDTNSIIIKDEADLSFLEERAPKWVESLRAHDTRSLCLVPFIHQGAIIGFLYIKNFDTSEMIRFKETVELVSLFLASEVANHLFLERMEYLSNVDMLTGVLNRNCMNVNVDELSLKLTLDPRPFSIAFCDLNGLKSINASGGHDQGDKLIVYAADILKEIFPEDKIYRAGGDEFVVMSYDSKKTFEEKIMRLREKASDPDWLYFAIGYYHDETGSNIRRAMHYADEYMYRDKDKFYEKYPDKVR